MVSLLRGTGGVMNLNRLGPDFIILINFQVIKKCGAGAEKLATFGLLGSFGKNSTG